jgi:hypothetical protein
MKWLTRGASAQNSQRKGRQQQEQNQQQQEQEQQQQPQLQNFRLFTADFSSRKSTEIPSQVRFSAASSFMRVLHYVAIRVAYVFGLLEFFPNAPPLQIVTAFFGGDSQTLLQVISTSYCVVLVTWRQWFDSKGLDMDGAENSVTLADDATQHT